MDQSQEILSEIVVFNKYAKFIPNLGRRETWEEICHRNMSMHLRKYPELKDEIISAYNNFVIPKKVLPSMRSMQFSGAPIELSNVRIFNCSYNPIDHPFAFAEVMFLLLSGCGVGYSVRKKDIEKLPVIKGPIKKSRRFLISDNIEGWADAVKVLVKAYTNGKSDPIFDYRDIRHKGALLVTAGGKAPGPDPLKFCIEYIRSILNDAVGRKLTSLECHDICCHISDAVLSGGIRRSACIVGFDPDDEEMLSCKTGTWWELNPQRGRANNSVILNRDRISKEDFMNIWERTKLSGAGEPGFYWTNSEDGFTNPCVSGDALVTVRDHGFDGRSGVVYDIPMKMLVEMCQTQDLLPMALSYNETTQKQEWRQILAGQLTKSNAQLVEISYEGATIRCTPDHKILTKNRGWIEAQNLAGEDELILK